MIDLLYVFNFQLQDQESAVKRLKCSIQSIKNQSQKVNIIVFDSSENSIRKQLKDVRDIKYAYAYCPGLFNKCLIINYAVKEFVKSDYFIFSDIDIAYQANYVDMLLKYIIQGKLIRVIPYNYNIYQLCYSSNFDELTKLEKSSGGFAHGNGLIHRISFKDIQGFNEKFIGYGPEDDEFNQRIGKINNLIYDEKIITAHIFHEPTARIQPEENSTLYHQVLDELDKKSNNITIADLQGNKEKKDWGVISEVEEGWKSLSISERNIHYWERDKGEEILRIDYDELNENSIVFDIGGYIGGWAEKIFNKYNCNLFIFEPVREFYFEILKKFCDLKKINFNDINLSKQDFKDVRDFIIKNYEIILKLVYKNKINIFNFGLSDKTEQNKIFLDNDSSSIYGKSEKTETIQLIEFGNFVTENNINHIDLLKINTEGSEFPILNNIIEKKYITVIKDLQIQFHPFYPDAEKLKQKITQKLKKTHYLTYEYEWIWENWSIK